MLAPRANLPFSEPDADVAETQDTGVVSWDEPESHAQSRGRGEGRQRIPRDRHDIVGQVLDDRFEVLCPLGEGGFGTIYRARDRSTGKTVALKVLHPSLTGRPGWLQRFEREARLVQLVRHPNVVRVVALRVGTRPYFAMEYLDGESLRQRLRRRALAPAEALAVLEPLCAALEAAHQRGIVHRDVKASNVVLARDRDGGERVVLLDFGVAKLLDDTRPALTGSRDAVGTPPCMAPEQIAGGHVDERTDVYGLGVLLYHMLTGTLPFRHRDIDVLFDMHARTPPPPPSNRAPVGPAIDRVVMRAMAKRPCDRFAGAAELYAAFRSALAGRDAQAGPAQAPRAVAVHVHLSLAPEAALDFDPALFDLLDDARAALAAALEGAGLGLAVDLGDGALYTAPLAAAGEGETLAAVVAAARDAHAALASDLASAPVSFALAVHAASEAALMRVSEWLPSDPAPGVFVHPDVNAAAKE